jgi:hypothetical protein
VTFTSIDPASIVSGGTISRATFGLRAASNFDDHETRILANESDIRTAANALTVVRDTMGRWYSTSNNTTGTKLTSEIGLSSWTATGDTPSGITVSGDTFTIASAGRYSIQAGCYTTPQGSSQTGYIGFSIKNVSGSVIYAYQTIYFNNALAAAALGNVGTGTVKFAAGSTFKVYIFTTNANGLVMSGDATNQGTFVAVQREG